MHLKKTLACAAAAAGALGLTLAGVAAPAIAAPPEERPGLTYTTQHTPVFDYDESRATGHYAATADGLDIWTEGTTSTDKVALYQLVDLALASATDFDLDYTAEAGSLPGGQLLVDLDGDGTPTGYLVIEDVYDGGIWLSANWSGDIDLAEAPVSAVGGGGVDWATFEEWTSAFPDARVQAVGFSLGSGAYGVGTVNGITVGGETVDFVETSVVVTNRDGVVVPGHNG
ncbi:hypothetical protein [Agromyces sp. GXQ0307]|uniref:hypothetical protein n=1 Tax=Agromyces sp. GXQ0307 TaxID=3377835 RepID=UPI00383ABB18